MPDGTPQVAPEVLGGRYRIEREVGAGGMATVYLAHDEQHDRRVAIKVLRPELAVAIGAERFLREIKLTAALQHPHILPLFDSGHVPETGLVYYVMPFIEGESLRERLEVEQQLSLPDALQILREVADALSYAHGLGLVHRDIKPDNIMLSRGHALLADFGIARAVTAATGRITRTGMAVGTVDYMSPEQAAGSDEVDARSDQYSLACVLYEMLAGGPPFPAPTFQGVLARHLMDPVPSLRTLRSSVPVAIDAAIASALAKSKADRFPSVSAFVEALEGKRPSPGLPYPAAVATRRAAWKSFLAVTAGVAVLGLGAWLALRPPRVSDRRVLVGLFEDRSGDPTLAGMAAQATTELTGGLARTGLVEVVDARSTTTDQASATELAALQKLARRRGAGSIVWGSYTRIGDSVVFQVQMADAATGAVLRPLRPVSGLARAGPAVVSLLADRVMAGYAAHFDRRLHNYAAMSQPGTYQAWKEFDAGWAGLSGFWSDSVVLASQAHMDRATRLDPQFVLPQAVNVGTIGWNRDCPRADSLAKALRQSSQLLPVGDEALVTLGNTECHPDPQAVYDATTVLLQAAPGVPEWVDRRVQALMSLYRPREALAVLESSDELKRAAPFDWHNRRMSLLHMLGRYQEALEAVKELRLANPDDRFVDRYEMRQLAALGRVDSVEKLLEVRLGKTNRLADAGADLYYVGIELKSHGFREAGLRACRRAVEWYTGRPEGGRDRDQVLALALHCAERWNEARQVIRARLAIDSLNHMARGALAVAAFHAGDRAAADSADEVLARFVRDPNATFARAVLATLRGDREGAIRNLRWAVDHGISWGRLHAFSTDLAPLEDDPRFQAIINPDR